MISPEGEGEGHALSRGSPSSLGLGKSLNPSECSWEELNVLGEGRALSRGSPSSLGLGTSLNPLLEGLAPVSGACNLPGEMGEGQPYVQEEGGEEELGEPLAGEEELEGLGDGALNVDDLCLDEDFFGAGDVAEDPEGWLSSRVGSSIGGNSWPFYSKGEEAELLKTELAVAGGSLRRLDTQVASSVSTIRAALHQMFTSDKVKEMLELKVPGKPRSSSRSKQRTPLEQRPQPYQQLLRLGLARSAAELSELQKALRANVQKCLAQKQATAKRASRLGTVKGGDPSTMILQEYAALERVKRTLQRAVEEGRETENSLLSGIQKLSQETLERKKRAQSFPRELEVLHERQALLKQGHLEASESMESAWMMAEDARSELNSRRRGAEAEYRAQKYYMVNLRNRAAAVERATQKDESRFNNWKDETRKKMTWQEEDNALAELVQTTIPTMIDSLREKLGDRKLVAEALQLELDEANRQLSMKKSKQKENNFAAATPQLQAMDKIKEAKDEVRKVHRFRNHFARFFRAQTRERKACVELWGGRLSAVEERLEKLRGGGETLLQQREAMRHHLELLRMKVADLESRYQRQIARKAELEKLDKESAARFAAQRIQLFANHRKALRRRDERAGMLQNRIEEAKGRIATRMEKRDGLLEELDQRRKEAAGLRSEISLAEARVSRVKADIREKENADVQSTIDAAVVAANDEIFRFKQWSLAREMDDEIRALREIIAR